MFRNRVDIADLQAKEEAYGHKLTTSRMIQMIAIYVLSVAAYSYILYVSLTVTIVLSLITLIYGYFSIVRREVNTRYYRRGLDQRHEFINIMTLALTNSNNTPLTALNESIKSLQGEFKQDMTSLSAAMKQFGGTSPKTHAMFLRIQTKYKDDVIFCQYLDQMETAFAKGKLNPLVFQELADNHDHMYSKQEDYIDSKQAQKVLMYEFLGAIFTFIIMVAVRGFGWKTYLDSFAHSNIGIAFSTIFMVVLMIVITRFLKYYYDESITTI